MNKVEFKPYSTEFAANPYLVYAALRKHSPIFHDEEWGVTFIATHEDVSKLLVHKSLGRTMDHVLNPEELAQRQAAEVWHDLPNYRRYISKNLLETEGDDHIRLRRLLVKGFTSAQVDRLRPTIQDLADRLIDGLLPTGCMDLLEDFVTPLTVHVIASLLGMPEEDEHLLRPWSAAIVRLYEKDVTQADLDVAELATTEFVEYVSGLIAQRRAEPGDDLVSVLVQVEDEGEVLKNDELVSTCILLLNAGHESTVNAAGNGMLALLKNTDQLALLKADPGLVNSAVEEMLRYDAPLQYFHRYVLEDLEFKGFALKRGDTVGLLYGSANRDPAVFEDPDSFDITRPPNRHLTFGKGRHFCLGAPLARLELDIVFTTLLRRLPDIRLASNEYEFHPGLVFRGLKSLGLQW